MASQYATVFENQTGELSRSFRVGACLGLETLEGLATDKMTCGGLHGERPTESGLEWIRRLIHVVPVKIHSSFEPQRVARTEPARSHTDCIQLAPDSDRRRGGQHDFETILTCVARARDEP